MTTPLSFRLSPLLGSRLLAGAGTLALLAAVGLFASRPAHTAGGPVPVTVANAPLTVTATEGQPVEDYINVTESKSAESLFDLVYVVPPRKQLVVESMSFFSNAFGDTAGYSVLVTNVDFTGTAVSLATLTTGPGAGARSSTTQPMHMHVGPGGKVYVNLYKTGAVGINAVIGLSGHLEDAP